MTRRAFMTLLGGAAAWPLAARGQQAAMRRISVLMTLAEGAPGTKDWLAVFQGELQRLGWVQGRNISVEYRWAGNNQERAQTYAAEFARLAPDVIFCSGVPALTALHRETSTLPIVFAQVSDPVRLGFVPSLARPGGNITGFAVFEHAIAGKWLELLKDTAPGTTQVVVIFDPDNPLQAPYLQAIEAAAPSFGMQLMPAGVRNAAEIEGTIAAFAEHQKGALIALPNAVIFLHADLIITLANRHRLPAVYPYRAFASSGGFISYGVDLPDMYRRAAGYIDLILKGSKPGELPVQLPTKFELVVNLKTAKALGLTIPEPFLQHADEVIE